MMYSGSSGMLRWLMFVLGFGPTDQCVKERRINIAESLYLPIDDAYTVHDGCPSLTHVIYPFGPGLYSTP